MSALTASDRALVLRHVASLRRAGVPASRAVAQVVPALPEGRLKTALEGISAALERGQPAGDGADPLLAVIAQGDEALPEVLDDAARAYELESDGRDLVTLVVLRLALLTGITGGVCLIAPALAGVFEEFFSGIGNALPPVTQLFFAARETLVVLGVASLALTAWILLKPGLVARQVETALETDTASRFALLAAVSEAGFDDATSRQSAGLSGPGDGFDRLPLLDRTAARWVLGTQGFAAAAAYAARAAAARLGDRARLVPLVADIFLVTWLGYTVGMILIACYLPLFKIAGSVSE